MKQMFKVFKRVILFLLVLMVILLVGAGIWLWRSSIPPLPSDFYTLSETLNVMPAGTLIRSEVLQQGVPAGAVGWRILYHSTDQNGDPIAVSGVVLAPEVPSASPRPVIAWAHGTLGVLPECGTSHTNDPFNQIPNYAQVVKEGFVVVATDYPGHGTAGIHPYLVGTVAANTILDSVRAAQQLPVDAGDEFVVWGRSQGGQSALWTAQLAADYAPELTLLGAVATAPALDLEMVISNNLDSMIGGAFVAQALYAWGHIYPDVVRLDEVIKPEMRDRFDQMAKVCVTTPTAYLFLGGLLTPNEYILDDALELIAAEDFTALLSANTPTDPITVPVLIVHGMDDTLIPIASSENAVVTRCEQGEDITFARYPGVEHDASFESGLMVLGWILDRFSGLPTGSTCG